MQPIPDTVLIYFDGEDWVHASDELCLVYPYRTRRFEQICTEHMPLFTKNYFPKDGDVIMDVGSGVGAELCSFSKAVGASGHVYAIEADPDLYKKNLKVVDVMGLKNVTCINAAIMEKSGTVDIGRFSPGGLDSSIHVGSSTDVITVVSKSIDDILQEYKIPWLDYIKINIEGAEVNALQGVSDLYRIKNWCISTHDFCNIPTKNFVVNFFNSRGVFVEIHEEVKSQPWKGGYIYVNP